MSPVCFVTEVLSTLRGAAPRARKESPQASALRLCSPSPFRFASGWVIPLSLHLLPPPSPGGVRHVGTCHAWHESKSNRKGENTMSSTANTSTIAAIDSKKPNTKQELITANIKLLIEQLEAGRSDALTKYLTAMSRFH